MALTQPQVARFEKSIEDWDSVQIVRALQYYGRRDVLESNIRLARLELENLAPKITVLEGRLIGMSVAREDK